jgi:type VI secretion system secreted protein Hcp
LVEIAHLKWTRKKVDFQKNKVEVFSSSNHNPAMIRVVQRSSLVGIVIFMLVASARAQVDIFMSVATTTPGAMGTNPQPAPTLAGDSTDAQYPKWISLGSAQMGVGRAVSLPSGGTVTTSNPSVSEVVVTKQTDSTTPSLYTLVCGGTASVSQPIPYVTIDFRKSGSSQVFYRLQMQNVYFTGVSTSSGGDVPSESISLFFTRVTWSYVSFDSGGKSQSPVTKGWDVAKNSGF